MQQTRPSLPSDVTNTNLRLSSTPVVSVATSNATPPRPPLKSFTRPISTALAGALKQTPRTASGSTGRDKEFTKYRPASIVGFPSLPFSLSPEDALQSLTQWALDPKKTYAVPSGFDGSFEQVTGGFGLRKASQPRVATTKAGMKLTLECSHAGAPPARNKTPSSNSRHGAGSVRCHCPFQITLEVCKEGCLPVSVVPCHNHPLTTTISDSSSRGSTRTGIPDKYIDLAMQMARGGSNAGAINHTLQQNALKDNVDVTWTYADVYNRTMASTEERAFDANNYIEMLKENGRPFEFHITSDESANPRELSRVFDVKAGGLEAWGKRTDFSLSVSTLDGLLDGGLTEGLEFRDQHGKCFVVHKVGATLDESLTMTDTLGNLYTCPRTTARLHLRNWLL